MKTMRFYMIAISLLLLAACSNYKTPGLNQSPSEMSEDTLCFRYGSSGANNKEIAAEIIRRKLDCEMVLRSDPLYTGPSAVTGGRETP